MKDEEMAEEYVKSVIDVNGFDWKIVREICLAYLAGLKAGRLQWHDLRKDPTDLPKDTTSLYLVRVYSWDFGLSHLYKKYGMYIPTVCEWSGEYFKALNDMAYSNARNIKSCIAWCEIPTFDKENDIKRELFPEITLPEGSAELVDKVIADAEKRLKESE